MNHFVFPYATTFRTFSDIFHFSEKAEGGVGGGGGGKFASFEPRIMQSPPCSRAHDRIRWTSCWILGRCALTNDPGESGLANASVWFTRDSCRKLHPIVWLLFFGVFIPDTPAVLLLSTRVIYVVENLFRQRAFRCVVSCSCQFIIA